MKLSIIMPVFNERDTIKEILRVVKDIPIDKEIIIVDDFSTDGTRELLKSDPELDSGLNPKSEIKMIYHNENRGKGTAIRTGLQYATGDVVIIQDADLEYNPWEYLKLIEPIERGLSSVVYGSRFEKGKFVAKSYLANKVLTFCTNLLYSSRIRDMETCYKCIKRDVINNLNLKSERFEFEPEITGKLLRMGYKILEIPISYHGRVKDKKIGPKDGILAIYTLIKWWLK